MNLDNLNLVNKTDKNRVKTKTEKVSNYVLIAAALAEMILAVLNRFLNVPDLLYYAFGYVVIISLIVNTVSRTDKRKITKHLTVAIYLLCICALTAILILDKV